MRKVEFIFYDIFEQVQLALVDQLPFALFTVSGPSQRRASKWTSWAKRTSCSGDKRAKRKEIASISSHYRY